MLHPPGRFPFLANSTRSSGVKSVNRRVGSGAARRAGELSIWPGLGGPCGVLRPTPMLDFCNACVPPTDRASHNPPAASSTANVRDRCFAFIVFSFLSQGSHSLSPRHYARFLKVDVRFGTKAGNSGAKRQ